VGPLHVHRPGGEWCCAAAVTHIYTHIYIHVDGTWCVCGALPYSLEWTSRPQADQTIERGKCVGLREERGVGLRDWCLLIILPGQVAVSF